MMSLRRKTMIKWMLRMTTKLSTKLPWHKRQRIHMFRMSGTVRKGSKTTIYRHHFLFQCSLFAKCCGLLYCSCPRPDNRHNCGCDECPDSADYQWSRAFFPTVLFDWASKIIHAHNMGIPWYSLCIDKWNLQANTLNPHNGSIAYLDCFNHRRKWFLFTPTAQ